MQFNDILKTRYTEVKRVLNFLQPYIETNQTKTVKKFYFDEYFSFTKRYGNEPIFDLVQFLDFATKEYDNFTEEFYEAVF